MEKNSKKPVIVISGPTASGKTDIASKLCLLLKGEIISADSRQVYKYLDAGTNKSGSYDSDKKLRLTADGVPQHLTDILEPNSRYSAGDFVRDASGLIKSLFRVGKVPVITGGTGLYLKALVHGLAPMPPGDEGIRAELRARAQAEGTESLYRELAGFDPDSAEKNRSNPQRMIRAIEVYRMTGKPITLLQANTRKPEWKFLQFAPRWKKDELYLNIGLRVKSMLAGGMIEETRRLFAMGYGDGCPAFESLGYNHIISLISGKIPFEETESLIAADTRHYAKRQLTWFRQESELNWLDVRSGSFDASATAGEIAYTVKNMI